MKFKHLLAGLGIGLSLTVASSAANALSFTLAGGETAGFLPPDFDLTPDVLGVNALDPAVFANAVGSGLGVDGPANITFTYMGNDAGYDNTFEFVFGNTLFQNSLNLVGDSVTLLQGSADSLLDFSFLSNGATALANGAGAFGNASIAIVLLSTTDALVLFNDDATVDADYDDMGIRMQLRPAEVPVPPAILLLLSGLAGLGVIGRRKSVAGKIA